MTRPGGKPPSALARRPRRPRRPATGGEPQPPEAFNLAAGLAGLAAGGCALALLLGLGYLLYERLWGAPGPGLYAAIVLFGIGGLYAGWIAGVMVYSAVSAGPAER